MTALHDHKNRTYTVIGIALAMFLGALDQTIVSTALPRIVANLGGLDRYTWVTTVYLLVSTLLVPLYGKLSDIMNRKSLELWNVAVFLVGSMLCGLAGGGPTFSFLGDGMTQLIVFRGIQGLGGAGLFALAFIIISDLYPPRDRGKIGGLFGAVFGLSSVLGPLIGGFLTDNAGAWLPAIEGWRWVFYVNLPLGAVALWFIATRMPRLHPHDKTHKLDVLSAVLMIVGFFPVILALQLDKIHHPWTSPEVVALLLGGTIVLVLWVLHSLKASQHPILDLRLFRNPVFTAGVVASFLFGAAFLSILVFLPLYMVNVQGVSATAAGASVIPLTLGIVLGAGVGGPVATRLGRYKAVLVVGSLVTLVGGLLMATFTLGTPYWLIVVAMVLTGMGFGPAQSLYSVAIQNAVEVRALGQATSFSQFSRQIGSTVGAALAGALFSATLGAVFASATGGGPGAPSAGELRQGPQEIRKTILQEFDKKASRLDTLFTLRGPEAKGALDQFLADPTTPAEVKEQLKNGTPALIIEPAMTKLEGELETIVKAGDRKALEALFATDEALRLPVESRAGIEALLPLGPGARVAAIPHLREQMARGTDLAIEGANLIARARAQAFLKKAGARVADATTEGISRAFAQAIGPIWWFNGVLLGLLVLATAALPSRPLRGRGEGAAPTPSE